MIAVAVALFAWILVLALLVGLCTASRHGDRQLAETAEQARRRGLAAGVLVIDAPIELAALDLRSQALPSACPRARARGEPLPHQPGPLTALLSVGPRPA